MLVYVRAMSTVDDIIEQTASKGGKSAGEANNSDAFEAFGLFRDYLDSKLCDLKKILVIRLSN